LFEAIRTLQGPDGTYSALCLSGGGIRSAAFSLGVLQALARAGLLEKFDFLSTVSGGGYAGGWLSTWIHRHPDGLAGVVRELRTHARPEAGKLNAKLDPAPPPVGFLRSYSHFLNPQAGLFTIDTWTWVGIYLRNLSLNWLIIIPLLLLIVALPRLYSAVLYSWGSGNNSFFPLLLWIAALAFVTTLVCVTVNRPSTSDRARPDDEPAATAIRRRLDRFLQRFKRQSWLLGLGVLPIFIFAVLLTLLVWGFPIDCPTVKAGPGLGPRQRDSAISNPTVLAVIGFEHLVLWGEALIFVAWLVSIAVLPARDWKERFQELLFMLLAGLPTWALVASLADFAYQSGISQKEIAVFRRLRRTPCPLVCRIRRAHGCTRRARRHDLVHRPGFEIQMDRRRRSRVVGPFWLMGAACGNRLDAVERNHDLRPAAVVAISQTSGGDRRSLGLARRAARQKLAYVRR
jgi:hypothetical protein